jgi:transposase
MYSTTWQTITTLLKNGQSCRQVAAQMHVSFSTVQRLYTTIKHTLPRKYGGCPAKVTVMILDTCLEHKHKVSYLMVTGGDMNLC